jgi:hypothetical protein
LFCKQMQNKLQASQTKQAPIGVSLKFYFNIS